MSSNNDQKQLLLNAKNFTAWKQIISANLDYKGCLDFLQRDPVTPSEVKLEKQALFILKSSIEPTELVKTGDCLTAKELWRKLVDNFEGSTSTLSGTVSAEWASFSGKPNEDLFSYCGRFEHLLSKLDMVKYEVPEDQKFYFFLRGLSESRREFCHTWKLCNTKAEISDLISAVKVRFHTDSMLKVNSDSPAIAFVTDASSPKKQKQKKPSAATLALPSSTGNSVQEAKEDGPKVCAHCGKEGHLWKRCFELIQQMDKKSSAARGSKPTQSKDKKGHARDTANDQ